MSADRTPDAGRSPDAAGGAGDSSGTPMVQETLTVQVAGSRDRPERLLIISRPHGGRVHVRSWQSGQWGAPVDQDVGTRELFSELERAVSERRRVSEDVYRLRLWLLGDGA